MIPILAMGKARSIGLAMILGAGMIVGAYFAGYTQSSKSAEIERKNAIIEVERQWREKYVNGVKAAERLRARLEEEDKKTEVIRETIKVYVDPNKDEYCSPSIGAVGLLNHARDSELPAATYGDDEEGRAASGLTYSRFLEEEVAVVGKYNELMNRHNALLEWIELNYGENK